MQVINWNPEWARPECVLLKRKCWSLEHNHGGAESTCRDKEMKDTFEWYVKWVGLGYEDCTWECEDNGVLAAPGAIKLFSAYEKQTEAARQRTTPERVQEVHNNLTVCSFFIFVSSLMIGS
jgi:chromodomain-helicase-DNA-binding protein 3